jgi:hypothetical protein
LIGAIFLLLGIADRRIRLLPHPIHTGFWMICAGVSIAVGSASGLWLVSPAVALGCAALVQGSGRSGEMSPGVMPEPGNSTPTAGERVTCFLFVIVPWLLLYEAVLAIGIPPDAISGTSRFEQRLPVLEWTQIVYASTYLLAVSASFIAKTRSDLRRFSLRGLWTMLVAYPAYLVIPLIAPKRPFTPHTLPGRLLLWERTLDSPAAAFPSYHVIWAILAAEVFARRWPRLKWPFYGWAILVAASCVTTSQHSLLDVLGGAATVALVARGPRLWDAVRRQAGRINYSGFAATGGFVMLWLAGTMAGPAAQPAVFVAVSVAFAGAAFWPQTFGFSGGLLIGALAGSLFGTGPWLVLAALSVGAGWIQVMGGLRQPDDRTGAMVVRRSLIALTVTRLWMLAAPLHFIAGIYLILAGLGRFVDAASRGGPRTPADPGLGLHQRVGIASAIGGALTTALGHSAAAPAPRFTGNTLLTALVFGLAVAASLAAGVKLKKTNFATP